MDCKTELISDIVNKLSLGFGKNELQLISNTIATVLNNYTLTKNSTYELINVDDYNDNLLKRYIVSKDMSGIAKSTLKQYIRETKNFLDATDKRACDITTVDVQNYLVSYKYRNNISNTTLNNMRIYINNFFQWLFQEEIIQRNPLDKLPKIKKDTISDGAISKEDEENLCVNCGNLRDRAIIETLFATGCRVSELVNIKLNDIDFYNKTIKVIGKGNKQRTVCISSKAKFHIQRYLKSRTDNNEYLFVKRIKPFDKLTANTIENIVSKLGDRLNIPNIHPHRFRKSLTTRLIDCGMSIHQVSKLLGHSNINTTMIYYKGDYNLCNDYNKFTNI